MPAFWLQKKAVYTELGKETKTGKPRLVVLGSGWGATAFIKSLPYNIS